VGSRENGIGNCWVYEKTMPEMVGSRENGTGNWWVLEKTVPKIGVFKIKRYRKLVGS
jgi:hypothetical protein